MAKVTVNFEGSPQGAPMTVPGLGVFENGSTGDVTDEQVAVYNANNPNQPFPESGHLYIPLSADPNYEPHPAGSAPQFERVEDERGRVIVGVPNEEPTGPLDRPENLPEGGSQPVGEPVRPRRVVTRTDTPPAPQETGVTEATREN